VRSIELIVVHASDAPPHYGLADIDAWHAERGFRVEVDGHVIHCGYHLIVSRPKGWDWLVEQGRPEEVVGAHARGLNSVSLGLCIAGRYDEEPPDEEPIDIAARCCAVWCEEYGLSSEAVIGHREVPAHGGAPTEKTCPGAAFDLEAFRDQVERHRAQLDRAKELVRL